MRRCSWLSSKSIDSALRNPQAQAGVVRRAERGMRGRYLPKPVRDLRAKRRDPAQCSVHVQEQLLSSCDTADAVHAHLVQHVQSLGIMAEDSQRKNELLAELYLTQMPQVGLGCV